MEIVNIIENLDDSYGGPAKSVPYMCKYLNEIGVDTKILSIQDKNNEKNAIVDDHKLHWETFTYNFYRALRYSISMKHYMEKLFFISSNRIIHAHNLWNYICYLSLKISKKYDVPLVVSIRGSLYEWSIKQSRLKKSLAWFLFQKRVLQHASCIHVTEIRELEAVRGLGINSPIAIIPNGINLNEFDNLESKIVAKQRLGLKPSKNYILFLSRLHPKKGIEFLIDGWIDLASRYQEWDLLIVGPEYDKKYVDSLKSVIASHSLSSRVIFTGMLEGQDRLSAFAASSLFVLPSFSENFGVAIAEAMASKLPVITTRGTPWEEIETFQAGWWVELNKSSINGALREALECDVNVLHQRGVNGFELIRRYEWKFQAIKMKQIYKYILEGGEKPLFLYEVGDSI